jgi:hypothetical protein
LAQDFTRCRYAQDLQASPREVDALDNFVELRLPAHQPEFSLRQGDALTKDECGVS